MVIYARKADLSSTDSEHDLDDFPILHEHWPNFAQAAAADAFGGRWIAPENRDFTDRPPPGAPAAATPKPAPTHDIVAALRSARRDRAA